MGSSWVMACATPAGLAPEEVPGPLALPGLDRSAPFADRVVLVSLAGLTPELYDSRLGSQPRMPRLAAAAAVGVAADAMETVVPATAYPAHATLVTGVSPEYHGVVSDRLLGERGVRATRYWHASHLEGRSLWQVARERGHSVAALGWPSTVGAEIDLLLPDIAPLRRGETWLGVLGGAATPWLLEGVTRLAPTDSSRSDWPTAAQRDAILVSLACEIAAAPEPPALWLLHLSETGVALQNHGPDSPQADRAFAAADARVGRLVACFDRSDLLDSTAIVLVGDRRVHPVHTRVDPNVLLARAGLLTPDGRSETGIRSWVAISRSSGGSAFVYAVDEDAALDARRSLDLGSTQTGAFRVVSATELRAMHADPRAWFGLEAEPGFVLGDSASDPLLRAAGQRGSAGYLSRGVDGEVGFVAWGAGLRRGIRVPRMHQMDVAPTLAALLGLPLATAEGRVLIGALRASESTPRAPVAGESVLGGSR